MSIPQSFYVIQKLYDQLYSAIFSINAARWFVKASALLTLNSIG